MKVDYWLVSVSDALCKRILTWNLGNVLLGNEDVYHLKWMHLHRGEPKRCYCGMLLSVDSKKDVVFLSRPILQVIGLN